MKKRESGTSNTVAWPLGPAALEVAIDLPPPFRLLKLRETGDAFAHARSIAASEGAGTLVLAGRFDVVEFAAVLEPDEALASARRAFYAGMHALADARAALAPPERPISIIWPDAIHVDGGLVGGGRLAWPEGASNADIPDWLVLGASVRTANIANDPVALAWTATLEDQGFANVSGEDLVARFARHLMSSIDAWQSVGFGVIARGYLDRLKSSKGATPSIACDGDLLLKWRGSPDPERHSLREALRRPSWLDADGKEIRR
jgi:hypothetical protein